MTAGLASEGGRAALHPRTGDRRSLRARLLASAAALSVAMAVALESRAASTDGAPTVVVVGEANDPFEVRVVAELRAAGLRVIAIEEGPEPQAGGDAADWALAAGAQGAVLLSRRLSEATILVVRREGHRAFVSNVLPTSGERGLIALQVSEAVRTAVGTVADPARTREPSGPAGAPAPHEPPAPESAPPSPAAVDDRAPPSSQRVSEGSAPGPAPRWGGSLGAAVSSGFGGFGASAEALGTLHWSSPAHWGLEALLLVPITSESWSGAAGNASLTFGLAALGVRWEAWSSTWAAVDAGLLVGPALARTASHAVAPYQAIERTTWVAAPTARAGIAFRVARSWRARFDVAAAVAFPRVVYTSPSDASSSWGRPIALAALSLEGVAE